jgi:hypothetical protein
MVSLRSCSNSKPSPQYLYILAQSFLRHDGYQGIKVVLSPATNSTGDKLKIAHVVFKTTEQASTAKTALDGFVLKKDWPMSVAFI